MRVTYIGYDFFSPVLLHLATRRDVRLVRVVSSDQPWGEHICHIADEFGIPLVITRARKADLAAFAGDSDLVLCAAYDYRLDVPEGSACSFLNLHPTLLPLGRGPAPIQWSLTGDGADAGVSLHVMTPDLDAGPIVSQVPLTTDAASFEVYLHRINQAAVGLIAQVTADTLKTLAPRKQIEAVATYNPIMSADMRTITPDQTGEQIATLIASVGPLGTFVTLDGRRYVTSRVETVRCEPDLSARSYVNWFYGYFPCADGYCLFHRANLATAMPDT